MATFIGTLKAVGQAIGAIKNSDEQVTIDASGITHVINYTTSWAQWAVGLPYYGSRDPQYGSSILTQTVARKFQGQLAKVQLTYSPPQFPTQNQLPGDEITECGSQLTVDIYKLPGLQAIATANPTWMDPNWNNPNTALRPTCPFTNQAPPEYQNQTSYIAGSKTVTWVKYFTLRPSSDTLGTRCDPPTYSSGNTNWLLSGSEVNPSGAFWTKRNTYLYSASPWPALIYPVSSVSSNYSGGIGNDPIATYGGSGSVGPQ